MNSISDISLSQKFLFVAWLAWLASVVVVETLEEEALDPECEAHFQDSAYDDWCVKQVVVRPPAHESSSKDIGVIKSIEGDLGNEPEFTYDEANETGLVLKPLSDLTWNDDTLNRSKVVATGHQSQIKLEQVQVVVFLVLFCGHLEDHTLRGAEDGHTLDSAIWQATLFDFEHAFDDTVLNHVGEVAVLVNAVIRRHQGLWIFPPLVPSVVIHHFWSRLGRWEHHHCADKEKYFQWFHHARNNFDF